VRFAVYALQLRDFVLQQRQFDPIHRAIIY